MGVKWGFEDNFHIRNTLYSLYFTWFDMAQVLKRKTNMTVGVKIWIPKPQFSILL